MMDIQICKDEEKLHALADLASVIWHEYFTSLISYEQIEYMIDKFQSYHALKKAIEEEHYTYFLAYENDMLIGYCGVRPEQDRLFLSKLYLHKDVRGKGYASLLLQKAITFANECHKQTIYLTCNKYNDHSLAVYQSKGFYNIDSVQTDIGCGFIMDDYVLQLDLHN